MSAEEHKKELPIATLEQAMAFDAGKPESRTPSRIVNAVMAAMGRVEVANRVEMSRYLGISESALDGAVEFDTGLNFNQFIEQLRIQAILRLKEKGQRRFSLEFVRSLGFANNSSLWHFMKRNGLLDISRLEAKREEDRLAWERIRAKEKRTN